MINPFDHHYFIGYISQITPQCVKIHFPSSALVNKFIFYGEEFNGGLVGSFIVIEGENHGFLGQLQEIEISEKERLALSDTAFKYQEFHPTGKAEILLAFNLFDLNQVDKSCNFFPHIGSKVFVCTKSFLSRYVIGFGKKKKDNLLMSIGILSNSSSKVTISQQSFFGRHSAIIGTTGGGKSWSLAKLIEEARNNNTKCILIDPTGEYENLKDENMQNCILAENSYFSYRNLNVMDLFFLLKPSEKTQAPKLLEAVKTLKTLEIADAQQDTILDEYRLRSKSNIKKDTQSKANFINFQRNNIGRIDNDDLNFDITALAQQIKNECIWDVGRNNGQEDITKWGGIAENEYSNCVSLITRVNRILSGNEYRILFGIDSLHDKVELTETIDKFLRSDNNGTLLRIGFEKVGFNFNIREILANAIGQYILSKARKDEFKKDPIIFMVDEAHQFLNKNIVDDRGNGFILNAFDQIAKEGRKYGLFLCIATQIPRDIPTGTLSQMGSFLVHRLINYNDKEAIRQACSTANNSVLSYMPILSEGEAILTGVDFPMPLLVKITPPIKKPDSKTPEFINNKVTSLGL